MTKKIIKVEEKKPNKLDIGKIKDVIVDNKDTIKKMVDIAADFLDDDDKKKKTSTKKSTTKATTKKVSKKSKAASKSSKIELETMIDLAGKFLK